MDTFTPDKSGIDSLGGFSYQIRVFAYYMFSMKTDEEAGFELYEDVSVQKLIPEIIDDNEDCFKNCIYSSNKLRAIQVKRTKIDVEVSKKILLNWMLLENSGYDVVEYTLFTDKSYNNTDLVFSVSADSLYEEVINTTKTKKSVIGKAKDCFNNQKELFIQVYDSIKGKYNFASKKDIDELIKEECDVIFKRAGVKNITYINRVKEMLKHITCQILDKINSKQPYRISYAEMMAYAENVCQRFTDEEINPSYSEFERLNKVDLKDLGVAKSREYKQLVACKLPKSSIKRHLQYRNYYRNMCLDFMEMNKPQVIDDIEETTYSNFEDVKIKLQNDGNDTPLNRLDETKKRSNSYAKSEQIRYGSGIYLTRDDESERKISWEDEENEKA